MGGFSADADRWFRWQSFPLGNETVADNENLPAPYRRVIVFPRRNALVESNLHSLLSQA